MPKSILLFCGYGLFLPSCFSYQVKPIADQPPQIQPKPKQRIVCKIISKSRRSNTSTEPLYSLMLQYDFIELLPVSQVSDTLKHNCVVYVTPVPDETRVSTPFMLSIMTLGLIPIYEPETTSNFIEIQYTPPNGLTTQKTYEFIYSAWLWLPLIPFGIGDEDRAKQSMRKVLDDFFYNEIPKAAGTQNLPTRRSGLRNPTRDNLNSPPIPLS